MTTTVIGALLLVSGSVMGFDIFGVGTRWRNIGMRYYDRDGDQERYDQNTRRFRLTQRIVAAVGLVLLLLGIGSLV
jgi:hypothetical protein